MDQNQNPRKRRHVDRTTTKKRLTIMVNQSTMTDCEKPMYLNAWTQTEFEPSISILENELRNRITKLEDKLKTHALLLNELTSRSVTNNEKDESNTSPSFKYKIISEGTDIQLEPIIVEYAGEDEVIYFEDTVTDINTNKAVNEEHSKYQECQNVSTSQFNQQNHSLMNVKQEAYSNCSSKGHTIIPKDKFVVWNGNCSDTPPITSTSSSNSTIKSPNKYTPTSTVASCTLPSAFNNFKPVPLASHQQQPLTNNNNPNDTANGQIFQHANSNTLDSHHYQQQQPNQLPDEKSNVTPINKTKFNRFSSSNTYVSDDSQTRRIKSLEHLKVNSSNCRNLMNTSEFANCSHQEFITIGPNNTTVPYHIYESIDWSSTPSATRKLLTTVFDRLTLATHSLTGKPSPAFHGRQRPSKKQLDPNVISDIVYAVSRKCNVAEREVRSAITTKCADENKMLKQRERKQRNEFNKENIVKNEMIKN